MLQFAAALPRFIGVLEAHLPSAEQGLALQTELEDLLMKDIFSRVPHREENAGFYSRYFQVLEKSGGMRPILDLSCFNKYIMKRPLHMMIIKRVLECVRLNNFFF